VADDDFEAHRSHLFGVAYRMLGSRAEAEDAVQEAWLRYATSDTRIEDPRAWLTTVVGRICLDVLRSARVRREAYVGSWLPEPLVARLPAAGPDPAATTELGEQISVALLVVLERLTPEQRVAFVLHDVFAVPFETIAATLGMTPAGARQHASRARRAVADAGPGARAKTGLAEQRRVLSAFMDAATGGDLAGLVRVLAPDVQVVGDGGGLAPAFRRPLVGAEQVARFFAGAFRQASKREQVRAEAVLVNGELGLLIETEDTRLVMAPVIVDGRIVALYNQLNPEKLRGVPHPENDWPTR
jgi:RNA polymerase sigma-70 factor (ECF subfamily)